MNVAVLRKSLFFIIKLLQQQPCWYCYFVALLRVVGENVVTDREGFFRFLFCVCVCICVCGLYN